MNIDYFSNSPIIDEEKSKENIIIIPMDVLTDRIIITIKSCNFSCELKLRISSRIIDHLRSYIKRSTQFLMGSLLKSLAAPRFTVIYERGNS